MEEIFLFSDYRSQFYSSTKKRGSSVDLVRLKECFLKLGFSLVISPFTKIDFRTQSYKDKWVLYQSSEDPGLFYRSYIDDMVLGLMIQGAKLIPSYCQFKAHHNKNFMEILRDLHSVEDIKNMRSFSFGTYEDYIKDFEKIRNGSYVLKSSNTSKSRQVFLLSTEKQKVGLPKKISITISFKNLEYFFERLKTGNKPLLISNYRKKFILQPYIDGLDGDYRVVVYYNKYYVLYRSNRLDDFRASGSGRFNYDVILPEGLLDYSKKIFESFNTPYIALDIGVKNGEFFLFEFQFVSFGQYTLEKSKFYFSLEKDRWVKVFEKPNLEQEISTSVATFIRSNKK